MVESNNGIYRGCNQSVTTASLTAPEFKFKTIFAFKGIPYAEPPVANLRFRKPLSLTYSQLTEVNATNYGKACKQPPLASRETYNYWQSSEDCLFLNIFTPSVDPTANLSVMVYIHGGGLLFDSARQVPSEQLSLRDVVVVTLNYRLGVFGFLCTDREDAPGNVGLWDQAMALNWTQNNIRNFGGNPHDVTLFGQSAGSVSVSSHIVSHVSRPYFKKAILQSGSSLTNVWLRSKEYSTRVAKRLANFIGCDRDYIECLRNKTSDELLTAQSTAFLWNQNTPDAQPWYSALILEFVQCFGDQFLPKNTYELLESGNYNKDIRILLGHTTLESAHFTHIFDIMKGRFGANSPQIPDAVVNIKTARYDIQKVMVNNDSFDSVIADEYTKSFNNALLVSPFGFFERQRLRAAVVHSYSDYSFVCPTVLFGKNIVSHPSFEGYVYQYYLTYANSKSTCKGSTWCTNTHFDDIPLVFGQPFYKRGFSRNDKNMSTILMDIFTDFAKTNVVNTTADTREVSLNYMELNLKNLGQTFFDIIRFPGHKTPPLVTKQSVESSDQSVVTVMSGWRSLGITYLRFSSIAAKQVRQAVRHDLRPDQLRETSTIKQIKSEVKSH
ncbi:unnamed protein product [Oppiella nova]|uniref:Carboxylic ester hydrolase n=1 Tax=Oppiella nova TaxID=334625 RepID=A0A7R9QQI2_9ACAR|nr:unnamed protein product [Oppiella nova]CAG2171769.1 unnamed protein product [Oppiella nova]